MNGDGREDVITFRTGSPPKLTVYLSQGNTFSSTEVPAGPGTMHSYYGWMFSQLGDFNGDGLTDIVEIDGDHFRVLQQKPGNSDVVYQVRDELADHARDMVFYSTAWSDSAPKAIACSYPQRCFSTASPSCASTTPLRAKSSPSIVVACTRTRIRASTTAVGASSASRRCGVGPGSVERDHHHVR